VIVDTSALLAFFDRSEPDLEAVTRVLDETGEALVVSPYVAAELDYLVASRLGVDVELAVLRELAGGAWELAPFGPGDIAQACAVIERYADQSIGLADASNVVLAARHRTTTIATLDRRHFDVLRPSGGGRFTIVP
jgi:predicted nucleic acid-binding protein